MVMSELEDYLAALFDGASDEETPDTDEKITVGTLGISENGTIWEARASTTGALFFQDIHDPSRVFAEGGLGKYVTIMEGWFVPLLLAELRLDA